MTSSSNRPLPTADPAVATGCGEHPSSGNNQAKRLKNAGTLVAAFAFTAAFHSASAEIINLGFTDLSGNKQYGLNLSVQYVPQHGTTPFGVFGGAFNTQVNGNYTYESYCADLTQAATIPSTYTATAINLNSLTYTPPAVPSPSNSGGAIAYLFNKYELLKPSLGPPGVRASSNLVNAAALQVAIWETEYDYDTTKTHNGLNIGVTTDAFGVGPGNFRFLTAKDNSNVNFTTQVRAQANIYLSDVYGNNSDFGSYFKNNSSSTGNQQLILSPAAADLPEPGVVALLSAGLTGGLGVFLRRRRKKRLRRSPTSG
jgi:hypothetical protein